MGVVDALFAVLFAVMGSLLCYVVGKVGVVGAFEALKGGMRRVVEGPDRRPRLSALDRECPFGYDYPLDLRGRIDDLDYPIEDVVAEIEALEEGRAYRMPPHPMEGWTEKERMAGRRLPNGGRPIDTPVVEQAPAWPTPAAPPMPLRGLNRRVRHRGEASGLTPLIMTVHPAGEKPVEDWTPPGRREWRLMGGPYDGEVAVTLGEPEVIALPDGVEYEQVTDPDSGAFLGGYAIRGWNVPCLTCGQHPHKEGGTALSTNDNHRYEPAPWEDLT
jgi:hypothetical protein